VRNEKDMCKALGVMDIPLARRLEIGMAYEMIKNSAAESISQITNMLL
jgi:hypothetical protein